MSLLKGSAEIIKKNKAIPTFKYLLDAVSARFKIKSPKSSKIPSLIPLSAIVISETFQNDINPSIIAQPAIVKSAFCIPIQACFFLPSSPMRFIFEIVLSTSCADKANPSTAERLYRLKFKWIAPKTVTVPEVPKT